MISRKFFRDFFDMLKGTSTFAQSIKSKEETNYVTERLRTV